ncbi:hypothetical protein LNQ81_05765 [Myroides sp. M-43]|uniref:hypothetical protein n=1 Tax=Myroides oncorhynchi TaxID=2893756 RepID=UPI001E384DDD|nr:hypothetical protein [Myroides oncorhynchi]MCC9042198.1 hypothetical protein [Myroides oncorhynchi]
MMTFFDNFFVKLVARIILLTIPYLLAVQVYNQQDQWEASMLAVFTLFGMAIGAILYLLLFRPDSDDKHGSILYVIGIIYIVALMGRYAQLAEFIK